MPEKKANNTLQAVWLGIGSLFSFGFSLVSAALISRYLTKDDYGSYKQVMYVYNTLLVVFTLGLPRAYSYFLPRVSVEEGPTLIRKLNVIFLILGLAFSLLLFFTSDLIAEILNNPNLGNLIKIFSPTPIFLLPTMGLEGILATYHKTQWMAVYSILTKVLAILFVALPVVFYKASSATAVAGFTISAVFTWGVSFYFKNIPFKGITNKPTSIKIKEILAFSLPLMFAGFWGIVEKSADQFYISRFFGEAVFADFANGSLELPFVGMVLSAGSVVLLPLFSRMVINHENTTEIIGLWQRSAIKAAYIIYPLVAFSWFFATTIMTFLYGDKYEESGIYFQIMLIINFFTIAQYYPILLALGKTKVYSHVLMIGAIAVWGFEYLSIKIFASPYLVSSVAILVRIGKIIFFLLVISRILGCKIKDLFPIKELGKVFLSSTVAAFIASIAVNYIPFLDYKIWIITVGFLIFGAIELGFALIFKIRYIELFSPILNKIKLKK